MDFDSACDKVSVVLSNLSESQNLPTLEDDAASLLAASLVDGILLASIAEVGKSKETAEPHFPVSVGCDSVDELEDLVACILLDADCERFEDFCKLTEKVNTDDVEHHEQLIPGFLQLVCVDLLELDIVTLEETGSEDPGRSSTTNDDIKTGQFVWAELSGVWYKCQVKDIRVAQSAPTQPIKFGSDELKDDQLAEANEPGLELFLEFGDSSLYNWVTVESTRAIFNCDGASCEDDSCELCGREIKLAFHHLVPQQTHGRIMKLIAPNSSFEEIGLSEEYLAAKEAQPKLTQRMFLKTFGAKLCRACHSTVHRAEKNMSLAREWNTIPKLSNHYMIEEWVVWAAKQRPRGGREPVIGRKR